MIGSVVLGGTAVTGGNTKIVVGRKIAKRGIRWQETSEYGARAGGRENKQREMGGSQEGIGVDG